MDAFYSPIVRESMDLVTTLLDAFHLNADVFERARFCGDWLMEHPGRQQASFHLVVSGECWLDRLDGAEPMALKAGDLLVMPRDAPHRLGAAPGLQQPREPDRQPLATQAPAADSTGIICGYFRFQEGPGNPVLDALPDYLLLHDEEQRRDRSLHGILALLIAEAASEDAGGLAMVNRLADCLFIQIVRHHLAGGGEHSMLGAALADAVVQRALQRLHGQPEADWTLSSLARDIGVSRSVLAERFRAVTGMPVMHYLTRWRMRLAMRWLRQGYSVARVAERCGYATEAGFSKAFRRHVGRGPGAVRREAAKGETSEP